MPLCFYSMRSSFFVSSLRQVYNDWRPVRLSFQLHALVMPLVLLLLDQFPAADLRCLGFPRMLCPPVFFLLPYNLAAAARGKLVNVFRSFVLPALILFVPASFAALQNLGPLLYDGHASMYALRLRGLSHGPVLLACRSLGTRTFLWDQNNGRADWRLKTCFYGEFEARKVHRRLPLLHLPLSPFQLVEQADYIYGF